MAYIFPVAVLLLSWAFSHFLSRERPNRGVFVLIVLALAAFVALILKGRELQGWDGIGYTIFALLGAAPIGFGLLLGLLSAWLVRRLRR